MSVLICCMININSCDGYGHAAITVFVRDEFQEEDRLLSHYYDNLITERPQYSVVCSLAYVVPRTLSIPELDGADLGLVCRMTSLGRIVRRSVPLPLNEIPAVLLMSLEARQKCRSVAEGCSRRVRSGHFPS